MQPKGVQEMGKIIVELSDEQLITPSGLSLVGMLLGKSDFVKRCNRASVRSSRKINGAY